MSLKSERRKQDLIERYLDEISQLRDMNPKFSKQLDEVLNSFMVPSFTTVSEIAEESHTGEDISVLSQHQQKLERRVKLIEHRLNMQAPEEIEDIIKTTFLNTPIIEKIYVESEQSNFSLIIVYNSESISEAIERIQPGLTKLEDELPDVYFDPHIFHVSEIREEHHQQSKLIFSR